MKDFFISSSLVTESACSMPPIVRFYQYDNESESKNKSLDLTSLSIPNSTQLIGSFGNQGFDFTVYFPIIKEMDSPGLLWLFKRVLPHTSDPVNTYNQIVSKKDIFSKFYVLELPDYGAQVNSPFFTDFTTHIYFDGKKLWQKYICFIKQYSKKKVYVLIDKNNNLNNLKDKDIEDVPRAYIRICFKEKERSKNNKILLRKEENYYVTDQPITSWFNFSSFESESYNLLSFNDFKIIAKKNIGASTEETELNPFLIKKCIFEKIESTADVGCETNICNTTEAVNGDYFRKLYTMNNLNEAGALSEFEKTHAKIIIKLFLKEEITVENIDLYYFTKIKEASYEKQSSGKIFDNYFNEDGTRVEIEINGNFEKIPEYNNITRFYISGSSTKENIQKEAFQKFPNVSRLNITNPLIIAYKNGLICSNDNDICDCAYIYDSGELENKEFKGQPTTSELTIKKSIDNINDFSSLTNLNVSKNEKSIIFSDDMPYSFLVHKPLGNFMNITEKITFTMVSRAFLIPLEVSVISNELIYCKIPDYFFANDYWNNSERNPFTDELFLRNLENIVYYSGLDLDDSIIYKIDNFEKESLNNYINGDQNTYLGNINLINFANRNL